MLCGYSFARGLVAAALSLVLAAAQCSNVAQGSYYDILGVPSTASTRDIHIAYLEASTANYPPYMEDMSPADRKQAEALFVCIAEAYSVLSDESLRRRRYDLQLGRGERLYDWGQDWGRVDEELGISLSARKKAGGARLEKRTVGWTLEDARTQFLLEEMAAPPGSKGGGAVAGGLKLVLFLAALCAALLPITLRRCTRSIVAGLLQRGGERRPLVAPEDGAEAQLPRAPPHTGGASRRALSAGGSSGATGAPSPSCGNAPALGEDDSVIRRMQWAAELQFADALQLLRAQVRAPSSADVSAVAAVLSVVLHATLEDSDASPAMEQLLEIVGFILNIVAFRKVLLQSPESVIAATPPRLSTLKMHATVSPDELMHFLAPFSESSVQLPDGLLEDTELAVNALIDVFECHEETCASAPRCTCCFVDPALYGELSRLTGEMLLALVTAVEGSYLAQGGRALLLVRLSPQQFRGLITAPIVLQDVLASRAARTDFMKHIDQEHLSAEMNYISFCSKHKDLISVLLEDCGCYSDLDCASRLRDILFELKAYYLCDQSENFLRRTFSEVGPGALSVFGAASDCSAQEEADSDERGLLERFSRERFVLLNCAVASGIEQSFLRYVGRAQTAAGACANPRHNEFQEFRELLLNCYFSLHCKGVIYQA